MLARECGTRGFHPDAQPHRSGVSQAMSCRQATITMHTDDQPRILRTCATWWWGCDVVVVVVGVVGVVMSSLQVGDMAYKEVVGLRWPSGEAVMGAADAVKLTSPFVDCIILDVKTYQDEASTGLHHHHSPAA
jgi:hypothetical protein